MLMPISIEDSKNLMTIIFYVVTLIIGILTYRQAKRTLFSPIKTEIFKLQVDSFREILSFFDEIEYKDRFDFNKILDMNIKLTIDNYLMNNDRIKINKEFLLSRRQLELNEFPIAITSIKQMEDAGFSMPDSYIKDTPNTTNIDIKKLNNKVKEIRITKKHFDNLQTLKKISSNPVIPSILAEKLNKIQKSISNSFLGLAELLNELNEKLPNSVTNFEDISKIDTDFINNKFNELFYDTDLLIEDIKKIIHRYYDADNTLKNKSFV